MNVSFIEFLAKNGAIRFGDFVLKSGRESPYFIDLGTITNGSATAELGKYYASTITSTIGTNFDVVFGPAYKAIPIALSTTFALANSGVNKKWLFDRKEMKLHGGDAGSIFVGSQNIDHGSKVVIVDDVITNGATKIEAIEKLEKSLKAEVVGIVIAVDRMERARKIGALEEFTETTGVPVHAIESIHNIFTHLKDRVVDGKTYVDDKTYEKYRSYMNEFGVKF